MVSGGALGAKASRHPGAEIDANRRNGLLRFGSHFGEVRGSNSFYRPVCFFFFFEMLLWDVNLQSGVGFAARGSAWWTNARISQALDDRLFCARGVSAGFRSNCSSSQSRVRQMLSATTIVLMFNVFRGTVRTKTDPEKGAHKKQTHYMNSPLHKGSLFEPKVHHRSANREVAPSCPDKLLLMTVEALPVLE